MSVLILALAAFAQSGDVTTPAANRAAWARCVGARAMERSYGPDSGTLVLAGAEEDCRGEAQAAMQAMLLESGRDPAQMSDADMAAYGERLQAPSRPIMVQLIEAVRARRNRVLSDQPLSR